MIIPGLKMVVPSNALDVVQLMAASNGDDERVIFLEAKSFYESKTDVPEGDIVDVLGSAKVLREGSDATIVALGAMVPKALSAATELTDAGIDCTVVEIRSLVPLDTQTILREVSASGRPFTVEENPRLCGWGGELSSIVSEDAFDDLDGTIVRITTSHIPLPAADALEDVAIPSVDRIVAANTQSMRS